MTPEERAILIRRAKVYFSSFYRCPTTNKIIEGMEGDDKVLCGCRTSNPRVPQERTEQTGVHIVRFLTPATAEEYVDERYGLYNRS